MKKHSTLFAFSLIAILALILTLPALAESASTPTPTATPIPPKAMMERYQDVLAGRHSYIQSNIDDMQITEAQFSSETRQWYGYEFETLMAFTAFCVTDLDADGSPEIILKLSDDFGFELLRYENGAVYGFPFVARAMIDITLNGDIYGSSGASDNSWYQIRFHEGLYTLTDTCRMQSTETGGVQYFIGDKEVSQNEYETFISGFADKARPTWIEFSAENFADVVSRF